MNETEIILSIIVISHEQREELRRCLDSILAMNLSLPYEIIVSDDRSTDGTYELAQEYQEKCLNGQLMENYTGINVSKNLLRIVAVQCNSDLGHCANNSQRSGYNRCNAYPHARGKYIAHVDADDYFRPGATVYEKQVAALEAHPECALAMSTCLCIGDDGLTTSSWQTNDLSGGHPWGFPRKMIDGEIISQHDFVRGDWFRLNQCFIQRRNPDVDPVQLYGNRYVDSVITYHHLQFGPVVYVDACDYVYIGHSGSVVNNLAKEDRDRMVMWCLGLYIPALIPMWTRDFYMGSYYQSIRDVIKLAQSGYRLREKNYNGLRDMHVWIYDCFARDLSPFDHLRLRLADMWLKLMKKTGWENDFMIRLLNILLTK